jgi:glycosyltransferase involved in cell wall biosynthesis
MADDSKLRVSLISRKPGRFNSIEKVFQALIPNLSRSATIETRTLPAGTGILGIILNLLFFKTGTADVHHITGHCHFIGLKTPPERTVLTIHDLGFLNRRKGLRGFLIRKFFLEWPLERIRWITAVSTATKEAIEREFPMAAGKVRVIPNPITIEQGDPTTFTRDAESPKQVLQIGTQPHKNLHLVVEALQGTGYELLILGQITRDDKAILEKFEIAYRCHAKLSDLELRDAYLTSDALVFCSTFEGFGLPIVEAQMLGVPVVTSDIDVLRETAGDGALFADPTDARDIREMLVRVLEEAGVREDLVEKGRRNTLRFSPATIAEMYDDLYREVSSEGIE